MCLSVSHARLCVKCLSVSHVCVVSERVCARVCVREGVFECISGCVVSE